MNILSKATRVNEHPLRRSLYDEIHSRPFPHVDSSVSVSHLAVVNGESTKHERLEHLCQLALAYGVKGPDAGATCFYEQLGNTRLRWEQHTEFSIYTLLTDRVGDSYFTGMPWTLLDPKWRQDLPGQVITAVNVELINLPESYPERDRIRSLLDGMPLIGGATHNYGAQLWSTFRLHSDDFGRVIICNRNLNKCEAGRLLRCVLELASYRVMSLLALPLARKLLPEMNELEEDLAGIIERISSLTSAREERFLLHELSLLAAGLEKRIAQTNYRFDAAQAYYDLTCGRLDELGESEIKEVLTFREFLVRRLTPAYRTVMTVRNRMYDLSDRLERATDLLRTRVSIELEEQNRALLKSMDRRGVVQLKLQQTVEGLSVVAITYYLVQLFKPVLLSQALFGFPLEGDQIVALSVPTILAGVWVSMRTVRSRLEQLQASDRDSQPRL